MTETLSTRMMELSEQMAELAIELNGKYHLNAVELAAAAMTLKDWAIEVNKEESWRPKREGSVADLPELSVYDI